MGSGSSQLRDADRRSSFQSQEPEGPRQEDPAREGCNAAISVLGGAFDYQRCLVQLCNDCLISSGMLEKDLTRRLGCSKTNMFSLGGVGALKQHAFFDGLNWDMLIRLQIDPPIRLNADGGAEDYSSNFHEGFTSRPVSPSVLEDTVCSPQSRSAAVSDTEEEEIPDFNFSIPFQCSTEQLAEFEKSLASKVIKAQRKAALRQKKADEKAERAAAEEEQIRRLEEEVRQMAIKQEEEDRLLKERQRIEAERLEKVRLLEREKKMKADFDEEVAKHEASIEKVQKRLKALRKKLREIFELTTKKESGAAMTTEQVEKLSRRQIVEDDIAECEEEEDALAERRPVAPIFTLLCDDELVSQLVQSRSEESVKMDRHLETGTVHISGLVLTVTNPPEARLMSLSKDGHEKILKDTKEICNVAKKKKKKGSLR